MNQRHKGSVKNHELERYFPVRITVLISLTS
jgi:hypothetical protein